MHFSTGEGPCILPIKYLPSGSTRYNAASVRDDGGSLELHYIRSLFKFIAAKRFCDECHFEEGVHLLQVYHSISTKLITTHIPTRSNCFTNRFLDHRATNRLSINSFESEPQNHVKRNRGLPIARTRTAQDRKIPLGILSKEKLFQRTTRQTHSGFGKRTRKTTTRSPRRKSKEPSRVPTNNDVARSIRRYVMIRLSVFISSRVEHVRAVVIP